MKKISVMLRMSDPIKRQDPFVESVRLWNDFADEVLVYTGKTKEWLQEQTGLKLEKFRIMESVWEEHWTYQEMMKLYNRAYDDATGDVLLFADLDWFIHEKDFKELKDQIESFNKPVLSCPKYSVNHSGFYYQKNEEKIVVNLKDFRGRFMTGIEGDGKSEVARIVWKSDKMFNGIPSGQPIEDIHRTGVTLWNFSYIFSDKEAVKRNFYLLSQAVKKVYGQTKWGNTEQESFDYFVNMAKRRVLREGRTIGKNYDILPKYIRESYKKLTPDKLGFNGWGIC